MKIQQLSPQTNNKKNNQPQFTGFSENASLLLRFLDTNQAWGANTVDLCSMVIPRTTVDFVNRGPEAGTETARREATGTANHSLIGVYGTMAGFLLAARINSKYGIKAHKIFADNETFEIITKSFDKNKGNDYKNYLKDIFGELETEVDGEVRKLQTADVEKIVKKFDIALQNNQSPELINKELLNYTKAVITNATGAENGFKFKSGKNSFHISNGIANIYNISKALIAKDAKNISSEDFLKSMRKINIGRSALGLGIGALIGMSTQPINMYLTKKKTGSDGFVGVPGRKKDDSSKFKMLKLASFSAFAVGALSTITTNPKKLLSKIQFKGMTPTVAQLKFVYGLTIASRLLAARDKDELRESAVKDSLGFLNLLVLGSLVTKGVAHLMDKSLINVSKENSKNFFKWIANSSLKTRDEVLYTALKEQGKEVIKNGKELPFKELIKLADKTTKGKLRALNIAQVVGYLYSGLVLGVGVPKLNIYMTNKAEAKRKARLEAEVKLNSSSEVKNEVKKDSSSEKNMLKPENLAYLSKNM